MEPFMSSGKIPIEDNDNKIAGFTDLGYRYKRAELTTAPSSHGLLLKNLKAVATDLQVPPEWIAKFLSVECGARCTYKATDGTGKLAVGHSSNKDTANRANRVQHLLREFIDKYVICPRPDCMDPEYSLYIEGGVLMSKCPACGARLPTPDQAHKVTAFITKAMKKEAKARKKADKKKGKKNRRGSRHSRTMADDGDAEGDHSGFEARVKAVESLPAGKSKEKAMRALKKERKRRNKAKKSHGGGKSATSATAAAGDPEYGQLVAQLASTAVDGDSGAFEEDDPSLFLWTSDEEDA